ncbi:MAG: hypothetical protein DRH32_04565 [Deltaproteobacteria bacterium]|nr:MAG: hypothetical protein DRH32_04565 [Deltaproteobacteria bacterium]
MSLKHMGLPACRHVCRPCLNSQGRTPHISKYFSSAQNGNFLENRCRNLPGHRSFIISHEIGIIRHGVNVPIKAILPS